MAKQPAWIAVVATAVSCPVADDTVINVIYRNKQNSYQPMTAKCFNWVSAGSDWDIAFYTVLKSVN